MKFRLDSKIYPTEAILNACYAFIDRAYIFLDSNSKAEDIIVSFKGKGRPSGKHLDMLRGEFMNELLHCALRCRISKENKKIREYIIGRALYSASPSLKEEILLGSSSKEPDYKNDSLGIAVPWEEKYGKSKKRARSKV
jgi:His-Xaa-Ser system protein HxsD